MSDFAPTRWSGKKEVQARGGIRASTPPPVPQHDGPDATDAAKALAAEHNIDLATVAGSGADGRIIQSDVQALIPEENEPEPEAEPEADETDEQQTLGAEADTD